MERRKNVLLQIVAFYAVIVSMNNDLVMLTLLSIVDLSDKIYKPIREHSSIVSIFTPSLVFYIPIHFLYTPSPAFVLILHPVLPQI